MLKKPYRTLGGIFESNNIKAKLDNLNNIIAEKDFWKDNNKVKKTVKKKNILRQLLIYFTL